jgi:hypothetical protein
MKKRSLLLLVLFITLWASGFGQERRFRAGLAAGLNFSELEGEGIMDYFGLNAGITGAMQLSDHFQIGTELLFSQNGEYVLPEFYPDVPYGRIRLNHIEIPVHVDWLLSTVKEDRQIFWSISLGAAYTRLLSYYAEDLQRNILTDRIIYQSRDGWQAQAGITIFFSPDIGLNLKAGLPIQQSALDWTLAARMVYIIT